MPRNPLRDFDKLSIEEQAKIVLPSPPPTRRPRMGDLGRLCHLHQENPDLQPGSGEVMASKPVVVGVKNWPANASRTPIKDRWGTKPKSQGATPYSRPVYGI